MTKHRVIFLSAQPDNAYFHWQVEVMIHNFMKVGVNPNQIETIWAIVGSPSKELVALADKYNYVRFFWYPITVKRNYGYIPVLRPDVLEQHFTEFPNLKNERIFYHDCDIVFRELPDFDSMCEDDVWYLSDTVSYIGADYIKSRGQGLLELLCQSVGVSTKLVEENNKDSGGAQYLMKGVDAEFWRNVRNDSLTLYKIMKDREEYERASLRGSQLRDYNPIQKFCADMWAVLWNALKVGHEVRVIKELDFSWASDPIKRYSECKILHNAGVTSNRNGEIFYKADWMRRSPFGADLSKVRKDLCSYEYVQAIKYAEVNRKD